jgi:hypothetical protein
VKWLLPKLAKAVAIEYPDACQQRIIHKFILKL